MNIKNIEHCTVENVGNPVIAYKVKTDDGWWIHWKREDPETDRIYKKTIIPSIDSDFSQITVIHESELPVDAIIC